MNLFKAATALLLLWSFVMTASAQGENTEEVQLAAGAWLEKLDGGDFEQTWESAGTVFKNGVGRGTWVQAAQGVREPLGGVHGRTVTSTSFVRSLPGVPTGQYAIIRYDTVFLNNAQATETVTVALEEDEQWRVVGYFVQ